MMDIPPQPPCQVSLSPAAVALPALVMDTPEGSSHTGHPLQVTGAAQTPNVSSACPCCGTAAPLGQPKRQGRAGATWSLLTPSQPQLRSLLADPEEGESETHSQEIPHGDIQVCSLSPPLLAALAHVTRAAQARQTLWQTLWHRFFELDKWGQLLQIELKKIPLSAAQ